MSTLIGLRLLAALAQQPATLDSLAVGRWLDSVVPARLARDDLAGAVVTVVAAGRVLVARGYGWASLGSRTAMDPARAVVPVASVSKTFTWTAVMQLVEQGKLDLDRDIQTDLDFPIPRTFAAPITLRNLMTHTAGFEERLKVYSIPGRPLRDLGSYLREVPPPDRIDPPGQLQAYSNYGTAVAGYIVERVSGEPFVDYIERHILGPLGMTHSTFRRPVPAPISDGLVALYDRASVPEPLPPEANLADLMGDPAGDLVTSAPDLARYMLMHLGHGRLGDVQILAPETADRMHAPAFTPMPGALPTALGFFSGDYNGHRVILHDGDASGGHSDMELLIDRGVGFFSFVNSDGPGAPLGKSYGFRAALWHDFMDRFFPGPPEPELPTQSTALADARLAAGEYEMSRRPSGDFATALYLGIRVPLTANADGTLTTPALLDFVNGTEQRWREVGPGDWRLVGGRDRLNIEVKAGKVVTWLPKEMSTFQLLPVPFYRSRRLNLPLFGGAALVILIGAVAWPIASRRRRRTTGGPDRDVRRLAGATLAGAAFLLGWVGVAALVITRVAGLDLRLDPWIRVVQAIGVVALGLTVVGSLATVAIWRSNRSTALKLGSLLTAAALVDLTWFTLVFHLVSWRLNY